MIIMRFMLVSLVTYYGQATVITGAKFPHFVQ